MKPFMRGVAALLTTAAVLFGSTASAAAAQDKTVLTTDRDKASYMIGTDIGHSIAPVGPDLDMTAFEKAIRNAFAGGKPLLTPEDAKTTTQALMARIGARNNPPAPGAKTPEVARDKVGLLVGTDVGRSLAKIQEEIDMPVFLQAVRTTLAGGTALLSDAELDAVRQVFSKNVQVKLEAKAAAAAQANKAAGAAFLAKNKTVKGVFTTPSGIQYMVLRQGAGPRPRVDDRVSVNYHGTLLDGSVFDSSYERGGQPVQFRLGEVIAGWTEGLQLMPVGAKYRFWIPGELAYGDKGTPDGRIGPNSTLVFDVELLAIPQQ
ncbi:FKBP-type peptidyl-prolyl cis-trans isomerase N-terminal domain-containing protein [Lysobacter solisilvae (ex Woo and Kim 2020)]|uniref:Peptidyl-prolyl cis-trans isomerase n=1 Tax=Agrilutibacter terrestris TaxID=2865112 RepID=A0A7H0FXS1_9GAMM|nr:FKBP-type peptidyl-prolyl cis-trans isomerase [Lysobacter terrestris]QNP40837.1 FKBP-type peptidyl-prolyl cis-trans isomerase [Lysobacter terrestris]